MTFVSIQYLRAIAALLVVAVHSSEVLKLLGVESDIAEAASVGVDLFFVISGFIMIYTVSQRPIGPSKFLLNRVARVAPIYWMTTALIFCVALVFPRLLGSTDADFSDLLKSMLFIPYERSDGTVRPMLFVGWSLNYEMFFYIIFAAALYFKKRIIRISAPIAVLVALVMLGEIVRPIQPELRFLTRPIILEFGLGMLLAELYPRLPASRRSGYIAAAILVSALALLLPAAMVDGTRYPVAAIPAVIVVGAALVMERAGLVPVSQSGLLLGDASYSLYLTHPFVAQAVVKITQRLQILTPVTAPVILWAIFVLACVTAIFVMRHVERPLGGLARRLLEAPRIRAVSSPAAR